MLTSYMHPLIRGLVCELPDPGKLVSEDWQFRWLAAAEAILNLLYPEEHRKIEDARNQLDGDDPAGDPLADALRDMMPEAPEQASEPETAETGAPVVVTGEQDEHPEISAAERELVEPKQAAEPETVAVVEETGTVVVEQDDPFADDTGRVWTDKRVGAVLVLRDRGASHWEIARRLDTTEAASNVQASKARKLPAAKQAELRRLGSEALGEPEPPDDDDDDPPEPEDDGEDITDVAADALAGRKAPNFATQAIGRHRAEDEPRPRPVIDDYKPFRGRDEDCERLVVMRAQKMTFGEIRDADPEAFGTDVGALARKHSSLMRMRRWQDVAERVLDEMWKAKREPGDYARA